MCLKQKVSRLYACADRLGSLNHQVRDLTSGTLCCNSAHPTQYVFTCTPSSVTGSYAAAQVCSFHHRGNNSHTCPDQHCDHQIGLCKVGKLCLKKLVMARTARACSQERCSHMYIDQHCRCAVCKTPELAVPTHLQSLYTDAPGHKLVQCAP